MSRLSRNILYNLGGQGLVLILGLVAVRFIFRGLGADVLGIIYFALALNSALNMILSLGVCDAIVREVASHFQDDRTYIRELIQTASLIFWSTYCFLAVALWYAAPIIVHKWIHLESLGPAVADQVLRVLGVSTLIVVPRALYRSLIQGLERMEFNNLVDVGTNAVQQGGIVLILAYGGTLSQVVDWMAVSYILGVTAYLMICVQFFGWASLVPKFSSTVARRNLSFVTQMVLVSLASIIHSQADKALVSKFLPIGVFGFYALASGAVARAGTVSGAIYQAVFPHFSQLHKSSNYQLSLTQYNKIQDLICFGMLPIYAAFPFATIPLFTYLLTASAARMLLLPMTFLALGSFMNSMIIIPYGYSVASGRPDIAARTNLYGLIVVLPVTVGLVYYFGLRGAAFSWIWYHIFYYAYGLPRMCKECLRIPLRRWYAHIGRPLSVGCLAYGGAWLLASRWQASITSLSLAFGIATLLYIFVAFGLIGHELRSTCRGLLAHYI